MMGNARRRTFVAGVVAALCSSALISACGGGGSATSTPTSASQTGTSSSPTGTSATQKPGKNATQGSFDPKNFGDPTTGASQFMPLKPGTQWVRQGFVNVGHRRLPHQVVTTVTDVSKQIDGVRTVAVVDQDTNGGQIAEQSIDWIAADKDGNVWLLGSYTEAYTGGQFVNASDAWLAGVKGSKPGILMLTDPHLGTPPYTEDTVPGIEAPSAQVAKTGQSQCVPFKCYKGVLVIQEGGSEYKYYAPGVGQIKTEPLASGGKHEIEDLVNLTQLTPGGLAQISGEAVKLDQHAKVEAPDVFGHAPAAKRTL